MTIFQTILWGILFTIGTALVTRFLLFIPYELKRIADALNEGFTFTYYKDDEDKDD